MKRKKWLILVLVAVLAFSTFGTAWAAWDVRPGIQQNLAVYVREGVLTGQQANAIKQAIQAGRVEVMVVREGERGKNYSVDPAGNLHLIPYILPHGRQARVIEGTIWLVGCDNLFVPEKKIVSVPPAKPQDQWEAVRIVRPFPIPSPQLPVGPSMSNFVQAGKVSTGFERKSVTPTSAGPLILPSETGDININNANTSTNTNNNSDVNDNTNINTNTNNNSNVNDNTNTAEAEIHR